MPAPAPESESYQQALVDQASLLGGGSNQEAVLTAAPSPEPVPIGPMTPIPGAPEPLPGAALPGPAQEAAPGQPVQPDGTRAALIAAAQQLGAAPSPAPAPAPEPEAEPFEGSLKAAAQELAGQGAAAPAAEEEEAEPFAGAAGLQAAAMPPGAEEAGPTAEEAAPGEEVEEPLVLDELSLAPAPEPLALFPAPALPPAPEAAGLLQPDGEAPAAEARMASAVPAPEGAAGQVQPLLVGECSLRCGWLLGPAGGCMQRAAPCLFCRSSC